jgi:four helix bundle protein
MPNLPLTRAEQKAHELALEVYRVSRTLPAEDQSGLSAQMRRATVAAASTLTVCRERRPDPPGYISEAAGEVAEVIYCLLLARELGYLTEQDARPATELATRALRLIHACAEL